jgi:hypothetical protein
VIAFIQHGTDRLSITPVRQQGFLDARSAIVLAFPIARRRDHVEALAAQMMARPLEQAEKHLAFQLRRKRAGLARKGLAADVVEREVCAFEGAVRRALWTLVISPPRPSDDRQGRSV